MAGSVSLDIIARDRASDTFTRVGRSADQSAGRFRRLGAAAKVAGLGLAAGAGAAAVLAAKLAKGAMEDEAAAKKMAVAFRNNAGATKAQIAATEDWISAQGLAKGVADDDLRPALGKLVAATHDVGKAQKLTSLAMDISAGSGKDLGVVTQALAKAQNGSTAGLAKFGVGMKDAKGKAVDFETAVGRLGKTFRGQAAAAADTTAGRFQRLKVQLSEAGETIGYKLLPYATQFAGWVLNKGIPAATLMATWLKQKLGPAFSAIGDFISTRVMPAFRRFGSESPGMLTKIQTAAHPVIGWFRANWPLIAGTVRDGVTTVKQIAASLQQFWNRWGGDIMAVTRRIFQAVGGIIKGTLQVIRGIFKTVTSLLRGDWSGALKGIVMIAKGAFGQLKSIASLAFAGMRAAVRAGASAVVSIVKGIPGKIRSGLGYLSGLLLNAGRAIMQGLWNGISKGADKVLGKVKSIAGQIKSVFKGNLGIFSPSRVFLGYGKNILEGLVRGIDKGQVPLSKVMNAVTNNLKRAGDRLAKVMAARRDITSGFRGIAGTALGAAPAEDGAALNIGDVLKFNQQRRQDSAAYKANLQRVIRLGLSADIIKQLSSQGEQGAMQLAALAQGSRAQIAQINADNKATNRNYSDSGRAAADRLLGNREAAARGDLREAQQLRYEVGQLARAIDGLEFDVKIDGNDLVRIIRKDQKRRGRPQIN